MPSLSDTFKQIANHLRNDGAEYIPHSLEGISSAMSFLQSAGKPTDDDVAIASYLSSQLQTSDAQSAANALNIPLKLIPNLTLSIIGNDDQLGRIIAKGDQSQALVAATVLFVRCENAARLGNKDRVEAIKKTAGNSTLEGSNNPKLAQHLVDEIAKIQITASTPPLPSEHIFSISIDLVGSTDAKTRVMSVPQGDEARIDELNSRIYEEFCRIERKFYESAIGHYGASQAIDPAAFFTVKGIGDEIWILCNVPETDIEKVGHALIDVSIEMATHAVDLIASENEDGLYFDPNFDYGKTQSIKSPIKIFIDFIEHATNIGDKRDEKLQSTIPDLLETFHKRPPTPEEIANVTRRLCLSSYEPAGWSLYNQYRTDFIGHEIDRFFRTTKAATPGTVTIGSSMVKKMGLMFKPKMEGIHAVFTQSNLPLKGGLPLDPLHACIRTLSADSLKGIGYAYDTYTLFGPRSLNGLYTQMASDEKNGFPIMPYHETRHLIPPDAVQKIVTEIVSRQTS